MAIKDKQQIMAIIASVFIAFLLWLYVIGERNPVQVRRIDDVPVTLLNTENIAQSNLSMLPNQTFTVNLTVKGRALDIFKVTKDDFVVEADLGGYLKRGDNNIPIEVKKKPTGIEIVSDGVFPYIRVRLDNLVSKSFPVNVTIVGIPKQGYDYLESIIKPSEVLVYGPEEFVNKVSYVEGQMDVSNVMTDITNSIILKPYDRERKVVSNVDIDPKYVDVLVPVKPIKEVPIKVVVKNSLPSGKILKSITPKEQKVIIIGESKVLEKIKEISTQPVDLSDVNQSISKQVELNLPKGVTTKIKNNSIQVDINVENIIQKEIKIPINIKNQKPELNYQLSVSEITLVLKGSESSINSIDSKTVIAEVDVGELNEGEHTLNIKLTKPEDVDVISQSNDKVKVTINKR